MVNFSSKTPPPECNPNIYKNGTCVVVLPALSMHRCEHWVSLVRARCNEPVDWFYAGRRNCILTTGDTDKVKEAMRSQWLILYELFKDQHAPLLLNDEEEIYSQEAVKEWLGVQTPSKGDADVVPE